MKIKFLLSLLLMCLVSLTANAQQTAKVTSFSIASDDHIPANKRRKDLNGVPCALVKVQVVDEIERVEGNKIGKIVNQGVEKWIYMCKGSRNMRIHLKNHLPVKVVFQDFKISGLESNRVYNLTIQSEQPEKVLVDFTLLFSPANATVLIDANNYKGVEGVVNAKLPAGQHTYIVTADGYESYEGAVMLKAGKPNRVQIDLIAENAGMVPVPDNNERIVPQPPVAPSNAVNVGVNGDLLTLRISPFYAKIKIDGNVFKADGDGELTIPLTYGPHQVIVEADGFNTSEETINIKKSISKKIKLSEVKEPKTRKGVLTMNENGGVEVGKTGNLLKLDLNVAEGTKITVDNNVWVYNGLEKIKTIEYILSYGTHGVKVECPGYESSYFTVNIGKSIVSRDVKLKKIKNGNRDNSVSSTSPVIPGLNGSLVELTVSPENAIVIVDEVRKYPTKKGVISEYMMYGMHRISVEASGYEAELVTINVEKSKVSKTIKLKKLHKKR